MSKEARANGVFAGFYPVNASPAVTQIVDLMLLPKKRHFNFAGADWQGISGSDPRLVAILTAGAASEAAAENRYEDLRENHSSSLAAFFNICTAMKDIHLQDGGPLDYIKQLVWDDPLAPAQDRFFAWVDARLVQQVTQACTQGKFAQEFDSGLFHRGRHPVTRRFSSAKPTSRSHFMKTKRRI